MELVEKENLDLSQFMDKHVEWTKAFGKDNATMTETKGFGSLYRLNLDESMNIYGDEGVTTSKVNKITIVDDKTLMVITQNSTYYVKKINV
jgi:hypothetical protein